MDLINEGPENQLTSSSTPRLTIDADVPSSSPECNSLGGFIYIFFDL